MTIDRNNYENYFLLYVDNELSDAERQAVDSFVRCNPDLQSEMQALNLAKLQSDNPIHFPNKASLFRPQTSVHRITPQNHEEFFVLYVDGELDEAIAREVETFAAQNPAWQLELNLFRQARLEPDPAIVFAGKESLLRRSGSSIRLLVRAGLAAAAVIGLIAGIYFLTHTDMRSSRDSARTNQPAVLAPVSAMGIKGAPVVTLTTTGPLHDKRNPNGEKANPGRRTAIEPDGRKAFVDQGPEPTPTYPLSRRAIDPTLLATSGTLPGPDRQRITNPAKLDPVARDPLLGRLSDLAAPDAYSTAFATDGEDGIYPDLQPDRKNAMRGIFRRLSRVLEKNAGPAQDGRKHLEVGGFQIALK
jgi:hypothetical protein